MNFQEIEAAIVDGNGTETGHIIVTTIGGKNGQPKQVHIIVSLQLLIGVLVFVLVSRFFSR